MDWEQIISITKLAIEHGHDVSITIQSDGYKQIDVSVPQEAIIETRTRYVVDKNAINNKE